MMCCVPDGDAALEMLRSEGEFRQAEESGGGGPEVQSHGQNNRVRDSDMNVHLNCDHTT